MSASRGYPANFARESVTCLIIARIDGLSRPVVWFALTVCAV